MRAQEHIQQSQFQPLVGVDPLQTTWLERGAVRSRVALLLRSSETQPLFNDLSSIDGTCPQASDQSPPGSCSRGCRCRWAPRRSGQGACVSLLHGLPLAPAILAGCAVSGVDSRGSGWLLGAPTVEAAAASVCSSSCRCSGVQTACSTGMPQICSRGWCCSMARPVSRVCTGAT